MSSSMVRKVLQQMGNHRELIPLFAIISGGCLLAGTALIRNALVHPEVSIDRHSNPHPFRNYSANSDKCFKVFQGVDYNKKIRENPPEY
ncbi:cytochrome c oxidase subunit NDUFA4-like [Dysidea avara]|uniref:cytochrome c oxidase subunit NDUFA4-like n=1 Tax=Dysidea avara TaxID=196820 RepID=UPI00331DFB68